MFVLYIFECISHGDLKNGHEFQSCWHFWNVLFIVALLDTQYKYLCVALHSPLGKNIPTKLFSILGSVSEGNTTFLFYLVFGLLFFWGEGVYGLVFLTFINISLNINVVFHGGYYIVKYFLFCSWKCTGFSHRCGGWRPLQETTIVKGPVVLRWQRSRG